MFAAAAVGLLGLLPHFPMPQRFPAEVQDAYAVEINPAGLALMNGHEMRLAYRYQNGDGEAQDHGVGVYGGLKLGPSLTLGAQYLLDIDSVNIRDHYRLAMGFGGPQLAFGLSWGREEYVDGSGRDRWDLGSSWRPWGWLALGLTVKDVAKTDTDRQFDASVALRPVRPLILSGRAVITDRIGSWRARSRLEIRSEWEIVDGLSVGLGVNDDGRISGQLAIDAGHAGIGVFGSGGVDRPAQIGGEVVWRATAADEFIPPARVAVLNVFGDLVPKPKLVLLRGRVEVHTWGQLVNQLDRLPTIRGVKGVYLRIGMIAAGWARTQEVRQAILRVKEAGLRVDCYLTGVNDLAYYLASACEQIVVAPPSLLQVDGLSASRLYFGAALERLGIRFEVDRVGSYKNSPDRYTRATMSEEERSQLESYMHDIYTEMVSSIAASRSLSSEEVEEIIAEGTLTATAAKARRLVDRVLYPEEMERFIWRRHQGRIRLASAARLRRPEYPPTWTRPPTLAVVHVDAPITLGKNTALPFGLGRTVGAETLVRILRKLRNDSHTLAVVLRVNSPGGDAFASDLLAREVAQLSAVKPVIASFGDLAASGGYYVSAPAHRIFAQPGTLTGSIGIYSIKVDVSQLLQTLGVGAEILAQGALAAKNSPFRPRSPEGVEAARRGMNALYTRFLRVVAAGRGLSIDEVDKIARGRIYSGIAAVEAQLVDEIGGLREAIEYAARSAGRSVSSIEVVHYPDPYRELGNPLNVFMGVMAKAVEGMLPAETPPPFRALWARSQGLGELLQGLAAQLPLLMSERPLALYPVAVQGE